MVDSKPGVLAVHPIDYYTVNAGDYGHKVKENFEHLDSDDFSPRIAVVPENAGENYSEQFPDDFYTYTVNDEDSTGKLKRGEAEEVVAENRIFYLCGGSLAGNTHNNCLRNTHQSLLLAEERTDENVEYRVLPEQTYVSTEDGPKPVKDEIIDGVSPNIGSQLISRYDFDEVSFDSPYGTHPEVEKFEEFLREIQALDDAAKALEREGHKPRFEAESERLQNSYGNSEFVIMPHNSLPSGRIGYIDGSDERGNLFAGLDDYEVDFSLKADS